jgi:hypothetical protein
MRDPFLEAVAADWQMLGVDTHACHLGELSRRRGRVWLGGRRVDVIFRTFPSGCCLSRRRHRPCWRRYSTRLPEAR